MPNLISEFKELRRFFSEGNRSSRKIVFYSEGKSYFPYFDGVLKSVLKKPGLEISYLTSDPEDPILTAPPQGVVPFYFRSLLAWVILFLDAKVLVMTMPDLNQYHLRRSVRGACHVYLFHAACSTHMIYRPGAFDHYDTIFCVGPHQIQELRAAERRYGLPKKQLLEIGYPHLDSLREQFASSEVGPSNGKPPKVLIAPSWGPSNLTESGMEVLAKAFSAMGHAVILRPHPESFKRSPSQIRALETAFAQDNNVTLERDHQQIQSILKADLLVTDWSGIALEYAFVTERPVLFVDTPPKVNNPKFEELELSPIEIQLRSQIGAVIPAEALEKAPEVASRLLHDRGAYQQRIRQSREGVLFHPGSSAVAAAESLLELAGVS